MYIRSASLRNVRSLVEVDWAIAPGEEPGWHVILGDNGSGKSTFLRALALALVGAKGAESLRQDWSQWITQSTEDASIHLSLTVQNEDHPSSQQTLFPSELIERTVRLQRFDDLAEIASEPELRGSAGGGSWRPRIPGWFGVGYGPFRRFTGGDRFPWGSFGPPPGVANYLTLFGENFALTDIIGWLQRLDYVRKDNKPEGALLEQLIAFVNGSGLLPQGTVLKEVSSDGVRFEDGNGCAIPVHELSDGFRSILSLTFELIRQLAQSYGWENVFTNGTQRIELPGVVLIDEVDVHLHPTWQHRIGTWFLECFPRLQFIVTTHSPIICQAANPGSVWRFPTPGEDEPPRRIEGAELNRLLYGNILDAYGTGIFGTGVTRSEAGKENLHQLAELNQKSLFGTLSEQERALRDQLRQETPTAAYSLDSDEQAAAP